MKRLIFIFSFLLLISFNLCAQIRGSEIAVMVQPDHASWNYRLGENAIFISCVGYECGEKNLNASLRLKLLFY